MNVDVKISPENLVMDWGNFEDWAGGASAAPTEWTLSGASAAVARESTTVKVGTYSAKLTRSGANCMIYHDYTGYETYQGRRMTFGCWVLATVASRARLELDDGVASSVSSYHSGGGAWEFLSVTHNVDSSATRLRLECQVNTGNTAAYFDNAILCEGEQTFFIFSDNNVDVESITPATRYRVTSYTAARREGTILQNRRFDRKTLRITGTVVGASQSDLRDKLDDFQKAINSLRHDQKMDFYTYDDRFLRGFLEGFDHNYTAVMNAADYSLNFVVDDPFYRFISRYRTAETISSSPTTFTVTNNGNVQTFPIVKFIADQGGDISSCTLENLTADESFSFTGTVSSGDTLTVDLQEKTVINDTAESVADFSGDFIFLMPGVNQLKFTGSNCTIKVDYFEKFI